MPWGHESRNPALPISKSSSLHFCSVTEQARTTSFFPETFSWILYHFNRLELGFLTWECDVNNEWFNWTSEVGLKNSTLIFLGIRLHPKTSDSLQFRNPVFDPLIWCSMVKQRFPIFSVSWTLLAIWLKAVDPFNKTG